MFVGSTTKGHFTHKTESLFPLHFKHSHWWKRRNRSKFASHYAWGTNGVCECKRDVKCTWILTWHPMDHVSWSLGLFNRPPLGGRPTTKLGDHGTQMLTNVDLLYFYHVWGPTLIEIHRNSICLRARSYTSSHYTWGSVTTLHDFEGALGQPLDTFFWALTISWSQLMACVWSGPKVCVISCLHMLLLLGKI
jgi:hypothetical protein